jgi:ketopantoate reductase
MATQTQCGERDKRLIALASERVQALADTVKRAGVVAKVPPSIQSLEWTEYVGFIYLVVPAVLTRLETYKFLQNEQTASVVASLLHEMVLIATAREITPTMIPIAPHTHHQQSSCDLSQTTPHPSRAIPLPAMGET